MKYRTLDHGEIIEPGDEAWGAGYSDDGKPIFKDANSSWFAVGERHHGKPYDMRLSTMRRPILKGEARLRMVFETSDFEASIKIP